jgi:hypothetical protein
MKAISFAAGEGGYYPNYSEASVILVNGSVLPLTDIFEKNKPMPCRGNCGLNIPEQFFTALSSPPPKFSTDSFTGNVPASQAEMRPHPAP